MTQAEFIQELTTCWQIVRQKGINIPAHDFVASFIAYCRLENSEINEKYRNKDPRAAYKRQNYRDVKNRGLCVICWHKPIDYSISGIYCRNCYEKVREKRKTNAKCM